MKVLVVPFVLVAAASAFQFSPVRTIETKVGDSTKRSVVARNANGREVPVETSEERIVSDSGGVRVVERTVRRYDANGNPGPPERSRIETAQEAGGATRVSTTVMRADLNGNLTTAERSTAITRKSGDNADTQVIVERPTLNAGFEAVERREETVRAAGAGKTSSVVVVQRPDANGRMADAARRTTERTQTREGAFQENSAEFEVSGSGMRMVRQTVSNVVTSPDGSIVRQVDTFEPSAAGRAGTPGDAPQLTKRQIYETKPTPTGTIESVSYASPDRLGSPRKVEETICTGTCGKAKADTR